jgi:hypothetical protein
MVTTWRNALRHTPGCTKTLLERNSDTGFTGPANAKAARRTVES